MTQGRPVSSCLTVQSTVCFPRRSRSVSCGQRGLRGTSLKTFFVTFLLDTGVRSSSYLCRNEKECRYALRRWPSVALCGQHGPVEAFAQDLSFVVQPLSGQRERLVPCSVHVPKRGIYPKPQVRRPAQKPQMNILCSGWFGPKGIQP